MKRIPQTLRISFFCSAGIIAKRLTATRIAASYTLIHSVLIGLMVTEAPSTKSRLKILEPITFPTAISVSPFKAAAILVTSSGREVPMATIVRPIRVWLTPKEAAISLTLFTTSCPPAMTAASPTAAKMMPFERGGAVSYRRQVFLLREFHAFPCGLWKSRTR